MNTYQEIPLTEIKPNPKNPRRHFDAQKMEELAASIRQVGVLEPILVRPVPAEKGTPGHWEIVAGERRFKAALAAGLEKIPAIVRELTDDEAYDFMLIENLQRDDLTELEEARSFKGYVGGKGDERIMALAEKTGIAPAYIRSRIRALELPAAALAAWEKGTLAFGHIHQLLRVRADKKTLDAMVSWALSQARSNELTVQGLANKISDGAPILEGAFFDVAAAGCIHCSANTTVQKELFGIETKGARCTNPACFKKHQAEFLKSSWQETNLAKHHQTNGFCFTDEHRYGSYHEFKWGAVAGTKCKACPKFVTMLTPSGKTEEGRVCIGDYACFTRSSKPAREAPAKKATGKPRDPEAPRAAWHGAYFRDRFFRARLEGLLEEEAKKPSAEKTERLCLYALAKSHREARKVVGAAIGMKSKDEWRLPGERLDLAIINVMTREEVLRNTALAIKAVMLEGQVDMSSGLSTIGAGGYERKLVGGFLGIDLAKEYAVDQEYLEKKTKAEILAFLKKFNLGSRFGDLETAAKLKKTELIKGILGLGDKLVGKVPAEILK